MSPVGSLFCPLQLTHYTSLYKAHLKILFFHRPNNFIKHHIQPGSLPWSAIHLSSPNSSMPHFDEHQLINVLSSTGLHSPKHNIHKPKTFSTDHLRLPYNQHQHQEMGKNAQEWNLDSCSSFWCKWVFLIKRKVDGFVPGCLQEDFINKPIQILGISTVQL